MTAPGDGVWELPDVVDPSVAIVSVEEHDVGDETEQRSVADAVVAGWAQEPWPEHLRAVCCFVSVDPVVGVGFLRGTETGAGAGLRVVTYAQWTSAPADRSRTYMRYRSYEPTTSGGGPQAGCVVFVTVDFDGPDGHRQRRWIDGVLAALAAEPLPAPGLIAAHFYASTDGTRVVNYAEWTSAEAHRDALANGANGISRTELPEWRRVREFPGVTANTVGRYVLHRSRTADTPPA